MRLLENLRTAPSNGASKKARTTKPTIPISQSEGRWLFFSFFVLGSREMVSPQGERLLVLEPSLSESSKDDFPTMHLLRKYSEATHNRAIRVSNSPHAVVVSRIKGLKSKNSHAALIFFSGSPNRCITVFTTYAKPMLLAITGIFIAKLYRKMFGTTL